MKRRENRRGAITNPIPTDADGAVLPPIMHSQGKGKKKNKKQKKKLNKGDVESLLKKSFDSLSQSSTIIVPSDRIELVLKAERQSHHHLEKLEMGSNVGDDDSLMSTFSLTSLPKGDHHYGHLSTTSSVHSTTSLSQFDLQSLGSEGSHRSLTSHEMVVKISKRVARNLPPPDFVPSLSSIDPTLLSWNGRLPPVYNPANPPINIIPCMVPLEVILAKADRRLRKCAKATKMRRQQGEERVKALAECLELKRTRADRLATKQSLQDLQRGWMRLLVIANVMKDLHKRYVVKAKAESEWMKSVRCARTVQRVFFRWYYREVKARLQRKYQGAFGRIESSMKMYVRIFRKRLAVRKLAKFLAEFKGQHKMSVVVHRFLFSVRKIQRLMRDFITCKFAKVRALGKLWDKIEYSYIRRKLELRREKIANSLAAKKHLDRDLKEMNSTALEELKEKDREWHKINKQMEKMLKELRSTGVIVEETEEEIIEKLRVPNSTRDELLRGLIEKLRRDFYSNQKSLLRKKLEQDSAFNEDHARNLLLGDGQEVARLFKEKFDKKLVKLQYKPFLLFSTLERRMIFEKVREAHVVNETFKMKFSA